MSAHPIPRALVLTFPQIDAIYRAGMKRGSDEATSFEWGESARGKDTDDLVDALHDILTDGLAWEDPEYVAYDRVKEWVDSKGELA